MSESKAAAAAALAPTGTLRAGINFANFLLTKKDPATGKGTGIAADIAHELARRLGVSVEVVGYDSPGAMADAVKSGARDVGFLAIEPQRAADIDFSAGYVEIEATYLVPPDSAIKTVDDVDKDGLRVCVTARSAYDLYLTRNLKRAQLFREEGADAAFKRFLDDKMDALAGLRPRLVTDRDNLPGSRILDGRFTAVQQAIGTPKGRGEAGVRYLREFVEDIKASGFVARAIETNGIRGLTVAAPAAA